MTSVVAALLLAAVPPIDPGEVLRLSDPGRLSPPSFRARLRLAGSPDKVHEVEVWHADRNRTLVRFLGTKEEGKFLLRRNDQLWLVSPRTRRPTRLPASYRLYGGGSLDEVLGRIHIEDYRVVELREELAQGGAQLCLLLEARDAKSMFPRARLRVRRDDFRAIRMEYWLRSGKLATIVDFHDWESGRPRRLGVQDLVHQGASVEVEVLHLEERTIPTMMFELEDGGARAALPPPLPPRDGPR